MQVSFCVSCQHETGTQVWTVQNAVSCQSGRGSSLFARLVVLSAIASCLPPCSDNPSLISPACLWVGRWASDLPSQFLSRIRMEAVTSIHSQPGLMTSRLEVCVSEFCTTWLWVPLHHLGTFQRAAGQVVYATILERLWNKFWAKRQRARGFRDLPWVVFRGRAFFFLAHIAAFVAYCESEWHNLPWEDKRRVNVAVTVLIAEPPMVDDECLDPSYTRLLMNESIEVWKAHSNP